MRRADWYLTDKSYYCSQLALNFFRQHKNKTHNAHITAKTKNYLGHLWDFSLTHTFISGKATQPAKRVHFCKNPFIMSTGGNRWKPLGWGCFLNRFFAAVKECRDMLGFAIFGLRTWHLHGTASIQQREGSI